MLDDEHLAYANDVGRIREWLQLIGAGVIPVPFADMDHTKAVPIAAWLADNLYSFRKEFPTERAEREQKERERALRRAEELEREAATLRAMAAGR